MNVQHHESADAFLERAGEWLLRAEAENNLMLGIAGALRARPDRPGDQPWLITLGEASEPVGAAVITPPRPLVVTRMNAAAAESLARYLAAAGAPVTGAIGPTPDVGRFAEAWTAVRGAERRLRMEQRIFRCAAVLAPPPVAGALRPAAKADLELLTGWSRGFSVDIGEPADHAESLVRELTAAGSLFVWEHGGPRSMAGLAGETPNGIRVLLVYTPPDARGRGWASACVAALTSRVLENDKRFAFLYTDLANPISNRLYVRIGYRPVCDSQHWRFTDFAPST